MKKLSWLTWLSEHAAEGLVAALVSATVSLVLYLWFEMYRDQVQRTHDFVLLFHSDAHSAYRDNLTKAWMRPKVFEKINGPSDEYSTALLDAADEAPEIYVAAFAMVDLLTNVRTCIQTESCVDGQETEVFRTFARGFHQNFFPILRFFDCTNDDQSLERMVLFFVPDESLSQYSCESYVRG